MSGVGGTRPGLGRLIGAEVSKLATLPATWITLSATWAGTAAVALMFSLLVAQEGSGPHVLDVAARPVAYAQVGFLVLGVLSITSEYPGPIRAAAVTTPRRYRLHLGKVCALLVIAAPAAVVTMVVGIAVVRVTLGADALPDVAAGPAVAEGGRLLGLGVAYLAVTTLVAFAVGSLLRRTIPAVATGLGYYLILGPLLRENTLPATSWLPDAAGASLWGAGPHGAGAGPASWIAAATWAVVLLAGSVAAFAVRDT